MKKFQKLIAKKSSETDIRHVLIDKKENHSIACNHFQNRNRPIVPEKLRKEIFNQIHGLSHPGQNSTVKAI